MNTPNPKARTAPHPIALAMFPTQQPMRREATLRTTSCLSSRPPLPQTPAEVLRQIFNRWPEFSTVAQTALNAARPGHREHPIRREPDPQSQPPTPETQPEKPMHREPAPGPLRNGNPRGNPNSAPRCGAKTRLGCPCKGPAMKNGRCRMHGGDATGPKTEEGRARIAAARTTHGRYNAEARAAIARSRCILERGRVLCAVAETGLPLEALPPLIDQIRGNTPCTVSDGPLALMTVELTRTEGIRLARLIRENTPYAVSTPAPAEPTQPGAASPASAAAPRRPWRDPARSAHNHPYPPRTARSSHPPPATADRLPAPSTTGHG